MASTFSGEHDYAGTARRLLLLSQVRRDVFPSANSEPAWNLMLALYSSPEKDLAATRLAKLALLPPTTAFRWLAELERRGFVKRRGDGRDKRLVRVLLTATGRSAVSAAFAAVAG